jgi:hypothetical protein
VGYLFRLFLGLISLTGVVYAQTLSPPTNLCVVGGSPCTTTPPVGSLSALQFFGTSYTRNNLTATSSPNKCPAGEGPSGEACSPANTYFVFPNVHNDGLPIYPVTLIWRAYPIAKKGYYSTFFWVNNGGFDPSAAYWGAHPYPANKDDVQKIYDTQGWEIAANGGDYVHADDGTFMKTIFKTGNPATDKWYTQVLIVAGANYNQVLYYPDVDFSRTSDPWGKAVQLNSGQGSRVNLQVSPFPSSPALILGGTPWAGYKGSYGNDETYRGFIRGIQIYNKALSLAEIRGEIESPNSTATGKSSLWYLKMNPKIDQMVSDVTSPVGNKKRSPTLMINGKAVTFSSGQPVLPTFPGSTDGEYLKVRTWAP